jgi:hypothetical protein
MEEIKERFIELMNEEIERFKRELIKSIKERGNTRDGYGIWKSIKEKEA